MDLTQGKPLLRLEIGETADSDKIESIGSSSTDLQAIEFELLPPVDICDKQKVEIYNGITDIDNRLEVIDDRINELNVDIDRLTNNADVIDYGTAVICGIITGIIDSVFVGEWNFAEAKAKANQDVNNKVIAFAKKDPQYIPWCVKKQKDPNRLATAIQFLEGKYRLPGDGDYKAFKEFGIIDSTHHLDDFCHHPTLVGLVCCILVQFTGNTRYHSSKWTSEKIPVTVNEYGNFVSENTWGKVFAGVINWFFTVAKTMQNRKGHLMSDMAGSISSAQKGNSGAGLPGSFMSTMKELASLPCFADTNFSENLRKAYQNGIGTKSGLDLGAFNVLFEGASSKFDMRTEMAIKSELKRQAFPVILNEILVRGLFFVRRFIMEAKEKESIAKMDWRKIIPIGNRTIERMITIAAGTFTAFDVADAAIRSGGFNAACILRINFVGIGRFAVAVGTDVVMGVKKSKRENERTILRGERLELLNAKLFYKEADMWIEAENTDKALKEAVVMMDNVANEFADTWKEISEGSDRRKEYAANIRNHNKDFADELSDLLEWGI